MKNNLFPASFKNELLELEDGIKINFSHGGEGFPLLLIHGYPQTHIMWHKIVASLSKKYYLICPDLRGYGDSSKPKGDSEHKLYSKKTMAKDMINLMDKLGFEKF